METIFDYNPTEGELKRFNLRTQKDIDEIKYLYAKDTNNKDCQDSINYQLGLLFAMRGNKNKSILFFNKIYNRNMLTTLIQDFWYLIQTCNYSQ